LQIAGKALATECRFRAPAFAFDKKCLDCAADLIGREICNLREGAILEGIDDDFRAAGFNGGRLGKAQLGQSAFRQRGLD